MKSGDFNAAAKTAGLDVKTTDLIARGAAIADVGASPAVDAVAFTLPVGGVSEPIVTDNGTVIVKVLEHQDASGAADARRSAAQASRSRQGRSRTTCSTSAGTGSTRRT